MRKLVIFIYCLFSSLLQSQVKKNYAPKVNLAIETYAFLKGQNAAIQKITLQFPSLEPNIATAEKSSKVLFRRAEQNIEYFLEEELGNSEFTKLRNGIDSLLNEQLKEPIEREKYALDFIRKVSDRPHSITDTLLLKGIISFAYHDAPHQEMNDGHINTFTTKGHPKADKVDIKIPIPKSWLAEEAEMPETIQQFTSYHGKGNEKILILVYDLPANNWDIRLNEQSISEMIPPTTDLIRCENVTIDGRQGMMAEVEETLNDKMKIRMLQFMFVQKRKLYCLQGSIGPVQISENLKFQMKKQEPLFRLIATKMQID